MPQPRRRSGREDRAWPATPLPPRGGGFHIENGEVNLEWKSVRMAGWRNRIDDPPMTTFVAGALDEIDQAGSLAQFGSAEPPQ
jgi:hypothetical protein